MGITEYVSATAERGLGSREYERLCFAPPLSRFVDDYALRFQTALLECQTEASHDGIVVVRSDGEIASFNSRFATIWGLGDQVRRRPSRQAIAAAIRAQLADPVTSLAPLDHLRRMLEPGATGELALKDGRVIEYYTVAITAADGTRFGRVGYHRDATDHARLRERVRGQEQALREQVSELEHSRQRVTAAEERLRREIAEILHGQVQSHLLLAWHRLGQCEALVDQDPARAKAMLAEVRGEIDRIREQEVRQASHLLHPSIIQVGLVPAVRSLAARLEAHFDVSLEVDQHVAELDDPVENQLPEALRLAVYRVVEEALNNIHRHAKATKVAISLGLDGTGYLTLVVRDDGKGFDASAAQPGLGMHSITDRVRQFGGTWGISGAAGTGTTLQAHFRLD
jgi:signal transduction histidine kinase